jgi:hypothetical protein
MVCWSQTPDPMQQILPELHGGQCHDVANGHATVVVIA